MFCEGLKKFGLIEEGSEVWLTANIVLGGSSNRRKSNPRVYQPNGKVQFYKMLGEVQTKNRCRLTGSAARTPADRYQGGNSEVCMDRSPVKIPGESQASVGPE